MKSMDKKKQVSLKKQFPNLFPQGGSTDQYYYYCISSPFTASARQRESLSAAVFILLSELTQLRILTSSKQCVNEVGG